LSLDFERCAEHIEVGARPYWRGLVDVVSGVMIEATGLPAAMGEVCRIQRGAAGPIDAEVVGFRGTTTLLMPHGHLEGIAPNQEVTALGAPFTVGVGDELLGRVIDGFGLPLDDVTDKSITNLPERRLVRQDAPTPLDRTPITEILTTGVRSIDAAITLGQGQRLGIFAGSGVGKSTLLGQISNGSDADVVVCVLVGERGREVRAFLEDVLGPEGRKKAVVIAATSDRPPIERYLAPFVGVTVAEYFRDQGKNVLVVMDSITRFAGAAREIGLAAGEPPTVRGYPPSFFATVPKLIERMGRTEKGSITGLITVLLDGDDPNEPVADTLRGLLDGHLYLSRDLAQRGIFPPVDILPSLSRLMSELVDPEHEECARNLRRLLAAWKEGRDLVEVGAYRSGTNPDLDEAITRMPLLELFLKQTPREFSSRADTLELLKMALGV
jgi:flagellum-specific ATP synthase